MAILNDLKKLLFGAKAVTKSATEKAVDATKEASSDLWDKVQDTATDLGKTVSEKADLAFDKAADLAEAAKERVSDFIHDAPTPTETPDSDDVMDAIIAERAASEPAPIVSNEPEESLALPPLQVPADAPMLLDDGNPDNDSEKASGFLDDLKNTATTTGAVVMEKGGETLDKAGDIASKVGEKVLETGGKLTDKFGKTAENVGEAIFEKGGEALDKAGDFASKVGEKVLETGGKFTEKFGETAENVGEAIFEKGGEALGRAKDLAADLGSKILQAKDDLMAKAQAEAEKSGETTSSLIEKAKELNQKLEDKISGNNTKFADTPLTTGGSEFAKHGSFWEKAERFAKGDHQMKGEQPKPDEVKLSVNPDTNLEDREKRLSDLIDDAIVEES